MMSFVGTQGDFGALRSLATLWRSGRSTLENRHASLGPKVGARGRVGIRALSMVEPGTHQVGRRPLPRTD